MWDICLTLVVGTDFEAYSRGSRGIEPSASGPIRVVKALASIPQEKWKLLTNRQGLSNVNHLR